VIEIALERVLDARQARARRRRGGGHRRDAHARARRGFFTIGGVRDARQCAPRCG
jgi:hypothetical protein